jgi:hypothetical protein
VNVGPADVLLVDDDNGDNKEWAYFESLDSLGMTCAYWDTKTRGIPSLNELVGGLNRPSVIWFTGDVDSGTLIQEEILELQNYLDSRGKLFLTGKNIAEEVGSSSFFTDYLHTQFTNGNVSSHQLYGLDILDGMVILTQPSHTSQDAITPLDGSIALIHYSAGDTAAIKYESPSGYKVVFFGFGFEAIKSDVQSVAKPWDVLGAIIDWITGVREKGNQPLPKITLLPPRPNPFGEGVELMFALPLKTTVDLMLYDGSGRCVKKLLDSKILEAGIHRVYWDGGDERGRGLPSGTYFFLLKAGERTVVRKVVKLK